MIIILKKPSKVKTSPISLGSNSSLFSSKSSTLSFLNSPKPRGSLCNFITKRKTIFRKHNLTILDCWHAVPSMPVELHPSVVNHVLSRNEIPVCPKKKQVIICRSFPISVNKCSLPLLSNFNTTHLMEYRQASAPLCVTISFKLIENYRGQKARLCLFTGKRNCCWIQHLFED